MSDRRQPEGFFLEAKESLFVWHMTQSAIQSIRPTVILVGEHFALALGVRLFFVFLASRLSVGGNEAMLSFDHHPNRTVVAIDLDWCVSWDPLHGIADLYRRNTVFT